MKLLVSIQELLIFEEKEVYFRWKRWFKNTCKLATKYGVLIKWSWWKYDKNSSKTAVETIFTKRCMHEIAYFALIQKSKIWAFFSNENIVALTCPTKKSHVCICDLNTTFYELAYAWVFHFIQKKVTRK